MWGREDFRMLLERSSEAYCIYCVCGLVQFEMAGRTRRGRFERDEELEVPRGLEVPRAKRIQITLHRRSRSERPVMSQMEAMKRFMVIQPPSFNGEPNAEAVEHWLRRIKRILVGLDTPEERRVKFGGIHAC
ncbi:hypothetical protein CK203_085456 [Vitis vinifera]|uniref:Uncharacterized protein n=1 Tax=Vitis vinifera TaxID=29760 RepID=A0A438BUK9_VITVI|nr:hypothetical protein CK203_085456 [Vitis vinifera]